MKLIVDTASDRVVGAHMLGPDAEGQPLKLEKNLDFCLGI